MDVDKDQAVTVILGVHNYFDNGAKGRLRVVSKKFWIHENFTMPSAENDLSIIELPDAVNFTDYIKPIKISTKNDFEDGKEIIVGLSGWGYKKGEHMSSEFFPGGSPLVLVDTQELIGITSFVKDAENGIPGRNDCDTDVAPAVFVRVSPYLNWISEKTGMKFE